MDIEVFKQLGVAFALSSLVGLEREQKYQQTETVSFGGVRTFILIGLFGALSYILSAYSIAYFIIFGVGFFSLIIASYIATYKKFKAIGGTTELAAILVFVVGILCGMERFVLATVISLAVLSVMHFKISLHRWAKGVKNREIVSAIQFIVIAFVVLPLLPNQYYGPFGFFNPYVVWLMIVFISAISFSSYVAIKIFGTKKGIGITGFLAGFLSSTALTLSFSEQSKKNKKIINPYVLAIVVASSAMFFRVLLEVSVLSPGLLNKLLVPMITMGVVGILSVMFFWTKKDKTSKKLEEKMIKVESPFSLKPALKFGAFFAFVSLLTKLGIEYMGDSGLYLTSFISGIMDVDAITVSVADDFVSNKVSELSAVTAITIAAMTNTFAKGGIFLFLGNKKVALKIISVFSLILLAGGASLVFVY
ncbi:MAG: MgtC/SapB family protein [Nitrospirota bacterium]